MSDSIARVRSGRSAQLVAVTGAGSPVGRAIVASLAGQVGRPGGPGGVVAIDADPDVAWDGRSAPDRGAVATDVQRLSADPAGPDVHPALAGARVVVHVANAGNQAAGDAGGNATGRRARAVRSVQEVAAGAAAAGAHRLVVVTSAMVYGARPDEPVPIPEDAPVAATRSEGLVGDLLEVERIVARFPRVHPGLRTTVIRPAALVGPGVDTMITRHLRAGWLLTLRGERMLWQFCHVDDLADAVVLAVREDLDGVLTAGCLPWLTGDDLERLTGMRRVELPARLAFVTAERLRRAGRLPTPATDLAFVVHPWVVSAQRLHAAGWRARHDAASCVLEVRGPGPTAAAGDAAVARRVEPRDAALGAAGAAVAILGTAALLRQARARRTGRHRPRL